jgi:hypothetical protein
MNPVLRFLIWVDVQVLRLATLGKSRPGETISAAAWSLEMDGKWQGKLLVPVIDFLFRPWMADHCRKAWLWQKHLYD